jgi:hypothetical protein
VGGVDFTKIAGCFDANGDSNNNEVFVIGRLRRGGSHAPTELKPVHDAVLRFGQTPSEPISRVMVV